MGLVLMTGVLVVLSAIALRFGADSRDGSASGWFEHPHNDCKGGGAA